MRTESEIKAMIEAADAAEEKEDGVDTEEIAAYSEALRWVLGADSENVGKQIRWINEPEEENDEDVPDCRTCEHRRDKVCGYPGREGMNVYAGESCNNYEEGY